MRLPAVAVPKSGVEKYLRDLLRKGIVDKRFHIRKSGDFILIPLLPGHSSIATSMEEFSRRSFPDDPMIQIRKELESLGIPGPFPDKWVRYGNSIMFNSKGYISAAAAEVYARVLNVKSVYQKAGNVSGTTRNPGVKLLHGVRGEIIHRENGVRYVFDPELVMFSPGNVGSRGHTDLETAGREVIDFYSGIGYFSLPIARYGSPLSVTCVDINPTAIHFLEKSARINKVSRKVRTIVGDSTILKPGKKYDIGIMGNFGAIDALGSLVGNLKGGGSFVIHHLVRTEDMGHPENRVLSRLESIGIRGKVLYSRTVKSYAPHQWHVETAIEL